MNTYKDDFGNSALILKSDALPYRGAKKMIPAFRLILSADYDNGFVYHISTHESEADAMAQMMECSGGTWKAI